MNSSQTNRHVCVAIEVLNRLPDQLHVCVGEEERSVGSVQGLAPGSFPAHVLCRWIVCISATMVTKALGKRDTSVNGVHG